MASLHEVGQALKEAREAQGRSQEEIAEVTRVALRHIKAIEEGDEKSLPEVFYVRSFLKKYADAVGLSANEVADAYHKPPVPTMTEPSLRLAIGPIVYYVAIAALIVGVLALAWQFQPKVSVVSEPSPTPTPSVKPSPSPSPTPAVFGPPVKPTEKPPSPSPAVSPSAAPAALTSSASPTPHPSPSPTGASAAPSQAPSPETSPSAAVSKLELVIQERSWVEVRANGRVQAEGLMQPGQRRTFSGQSFEVTAGNAGGVRIFLNGQDKGVLGDRGVVLTKTFSP